MFVIPVILLIFSQTAWSDIQLFDIDTNEIIEAPFVKYLNGRDGNEEQGEGERPGWPCKCQTRQCGCCFGMNFDRWNISQQMCGNMIYDPIEFSMTFNMLWNENEMYSRSWSGKNPSPMCVPIIIPNIPIQMEMCMKLFNVFQPGNNLHMCMDMEMYMQKVKLLILHFDCMRMGQDFALMKPEENGGMDENGNFIGNSS